MIINQYLYYFMKDLNLILLLINTFFRSPLILFPYCSIWFAIVLIENLLQVFKCNPECLQEDAPEPKFRVKIFTTSLLLQMTLLFLFYQRTFGKVFLPRTKFRVIFLKVWKHFIQKNQQKSFWGKWSKMSTSSMVK